MSTLPTVEYRSLPLSKLRPADYNPREISDEALDGLGATVERFGLVQPIVWNQRTGNIVGGHQRLKVLEQTEQTEAWVAIVDLSDNDEKALNIALNNAHITGDFTDGLQKLLAELRDEDFELFEDIALDRLLDDAPIETDWEKALGAEAGGDEEPTVMQRSFVLSMEQVEVLDEALDLAKEQGLALDPNNQNAAGNALHAVCAGFLAWARQSQ